MCNKERCFCRFLCSVATACFDFLKGILLLLPLMVHECLLFLVTVSVCVGLTAVLSFLHEICWYRLLAVDIQAVLTLAFLTAFGEGATLLLRDSYITKYYNQIREQFPWTVRLVKISFLLVSFTLAISLIYVGYKDAHPSSYVFGDMDATDGEINPATLNTTSTFLVLCSLSFLTYTLPRLTDWCKYRYRMNPEDLNVQLGSKLYIVFFLAQTLLLGVYAIPVLILAFVCYFMHLSPINVFSILILNSIGVGINASQLENLYISRFHPMQPPNYPYENHLATRVNLFQYVLIPMIALAYYGTGPIGSFGDEAQFYIFNILVALTLLQATKCTFNNHYLQGIYRLRRILRNNRVEAYIHDLEDPTTQQVQTDESQIDVGVMAEPETQSEKNVSSKESIAKQALDEILQNVERETTEGNGNSGTATGSSQADKDKNVVQ